MQRARVIVAGLGGMSREWLKYATSHAKDVEIVALVDVVLQSAKARAAEFQLAVPIFQDVQQALTEVPADLLWDITLPESREAVVTSALEHGLDVFSEKPMADSWQAARRLQERARDCGRRLLVMQNRRYHPKLRAFQHLLQEGRIGQVGMVAADFFLGPHFGGFRDAMDEPLLLDMAIHTFDQARFLLGGRAKSVYCHAYNPPGSWYQGHASAIAIFTWDNGAVFEYRGSWAAEGCPTSWEADWRVVGSRGTARWDGEGVPYAETVDEAASPSFIRKTDRTWAVVEDGVLGGHARALDAMMSSWRSNRPAETEAKDNIQSLAMVFGAIESARLGQKVFLPDGLDQRP